MKFDFAISFAGQDREIAREIARRLKDQHFDVFFDEDFEHEMLGRDGADYLTEVYFRESRFCVALLSGAYDERAWTQLERRAAQARELLEGPSFLLPVLVCDVRPSWLLPTRIHFNLEQRGVNALIDILCRKASSEFGRYRLAATFDAPFGDQSFNVSACLSDDSFTLWSMGEGSQEVRCLNRKAATETPSWRLTEINARLSPNPRYVFRSDRYLIAVPDKGNAPLSVIELHNGRVQEINFPRRAKWNMITDAMFDGATALVGFCGGDVWRVDVGTSVTDCLAENTDEVDYASCDFAGNSAVILGSDSLAKVLNFDSTYHELECADDGILGVRYLGLSQTAVVAGATGVWIFRIPSGELLHRQKPVLGSAFDLCAAREGSTIAWTSGWPVGENFLEIFDVDQRRLLASVSSRTFSNKHDTFARSWNHLAISSHGRSIAAVVDRCLVVLEIRVPTL